ncbi:MAG TPA: hypothetical protein VF111_04030, partial [Thermoanaerobaculia bacterium]
NNTPEHYDNATFKPSFQQPGREGMWNPNGTGAFRLVDCRVTRVCYADGTSTDDPRVDPAVGWRIADAELPVAANIVDLDPQQQMVSQIWALVVRLVNGTTNVFTGPFAVTSFTDMWDRTKPGPGGIPAGAVYQSVIGPVIWGNTSASRFLSELNPPRTVRQLLSIKFNVDGYNMDPSSPAFTFGRIVGTIGPANENEPRHLTIGRQLFAAKTGRLTCVVDAANRRITADFGNVLETQRPGGPLADAGDLTLGWLDKGDAFNPIGAVAYRQPGWYESTAGVQAFALSQPQLQAITSARIALRGTVLQENLDGLYARADTFTYRLYPGETASVTIYATRYGVLQDGMPIVVFADPGGLGGAEDKPPAVAKPANAISGFNPNTPIIAKNGIATLNITAADPGNPRRYIDGQVYGVRYLPRAIFDDRTAPGVFVHEPDFISLRVWNAFEVPAQPTWFGHIQPILTQYGNLYPVMKKFVDLTDYDSIVKNKAFMIARLSLLQNLPGSMPVTRDLSPPKRKAILQWLNNPVKGTPPPRAERTAEVLIAAAAPAEEGVPAGVTGLAAEKIGLDADDFETK